MQMRSPRTLLAVSAALALTAAVLAPTAAFAKGPGPGGGDCGAECADDQAQAQQQIRALDGSGGQAQTRTQTRDGSASGQQTATKASAGGGQQVKARAGNGGNQRVKRNQQAKGNQNGPGLGPIEDDTTRGPGSCEDCDIEMGTLDADQIADLVFMANEEKMAHDVYAYFATLYDVPIFERIAWSESRHQAAVDAVLERYGIEDDTSTLEPGRFNDDGIIAMYAELIARGEASLEAALAVGVEIEKVDIADLERTLEALGDSAPDVTNMYENLLRASGFHLNAFERQL